MHKQLYEEYLRFLGVQQPVTEENIKKAFRVFTKKYHPDVNKASDAGEVFKKGKNSLDYLLENLQEYNIECENERRKQSSTTHRARQKQKSSTINNRQRERQKQKSSTINNRQRERQNKEYNRQIFDTLFNLQELWQGL